MQRYFRDGVGNVGILKYPRQFQNENTRESLYIYTAGIHMYLLQNHYLSLLQTNVRLHSCAFFRELQRDESLNNRVVRHTLHATLF